MRNRSFSRSGAAAQAENLSLLDFFIFGSFFAAGVVLAALIQSGAPI